MNKKLLLSLFFLLVGFISCQTIQAFVDRKLVMGTIDLPAHFGKISSVRIWHGGVIIPCEVDTKSKKISFELSVNKNQTFFYLVIIDEIIPTIKDNTVRYFSATKLADYKIFSLTLQSEEIQEQTVYNWIIKELHIPLSRIPDDAIIVYLPGSYVDRLEGGSAIELPKLVLKKTIDQEITYNTFNKQLLKAMNYDALHATLTREVKQEKSLTTLIAFNP